MPAKKTKAPRPIATFRRVRVLTANADSDTRSASSMSAGALEQQDVTLVRSALTQLTVTDSLIAASVGYFGKQACGIAWTQLCDSSPVNLSRRACQSMLAGAAPESSNGPLCVSSRTVYIAHASPVMNRGSHVDHFSGRPHKYTAKILSKGGSETNQIGDCQNAKIGRWQQTPCTPDAADHSIAV